MILLIAQDSVQVISLKENLSTFEKYLIFYSRFSIVFIFRSHRVIEGSYICLNSLASNQHCILFTSYPHLSEEFKIERPEFHHMALSVSLRSTTEILNFANDWRRFNQFKDDQVAECKPGHNFYGEKPEICLVPSITDRKSRDPLSDFIKKCISTILHYAYRQDFGFLPVVTEIHDEILDRVIAGLAVKSSPKQIFCKKYEPGCFSQMLKSEPPSVWFFRTLVVEGAEFPLVILLTCPTYKDLNYEHQFGFFSAITRATKKLVIVRSTGYTKLDIKEEKLMFFEMRMRKKLKNAFNSSGTNKIVIIGIVQKFMPFKKILISDQTIRHPKVESIQLFEGPRGKLVFQLDDIYRKEDIKELISYGITDVIIVGDIENLHDLTKSFYSQTKYLLDLNRGTFTFTTINYYESFFLELSSTSELNKFLNEKAQQREQTALEVILEKRTEIPTSGPSSKWAKWKEKATELYRCRNHVRALETYKNSFFLLAREQNDHIKKADFRTAFNDQKEKAKLKTNICKMILCCLEEDRFEGNLKEQSFQSCIYLAVFAACEAIKLNPCWDRSYRRLSEIKQTINRMVENENKQFHETNTYIQKLIEQDVWRGKINGLRCYDWGQLKVGDAEFLARLKEVENKRSEYAQAVQRYAQAVRSLQIGNMVARRIHLAECLSNLATESLTALKAAEPNAVDSESRGYFIKSSMYQFLNFSLALALESFEWNPCSQQNREVLKNVSLVLEEWMTDIRSISTIMGDEIFFQRLVEMWGRQIEVRNNSTYSQINQNFSKIIQFCNLGFRFFINIIRLICRTIFKKVFRLT